jgi:serine/threonine protein kinase
MQAQQNKVLGLFNPERYNRWRFEELSSGSNGVIYTNRRVPNGLVKVTKNLTNFNANNSKLSKNEREKSLERKKRILVNGVTKEFETTKYVYNTLQAAGIYPFVPEVSNFHVSPQGNKALFRMKRIPGVTLREFAKESTTSVGDLEKVKIQCFQHITNLEKIGILHGDLNPNNIMVNKTKDGIKVYFIDFGRSKKIANSVPGNLVHHPWGTTIGCKNGARVCALPYIDPNNSSVLPFGNNRKFAKSVFPTNKAKVVSYSRRYKNLQNILRSQVNSFEFINKKFKPKLLARVNINENIKNAIEKKKISMINLTHKNIRETLKHLNYLNSIKSTIPFKTPSRTPKSSGCGMFGCFGGGPSQKNV